MERGQPRRGLEIKTDFPLGVLPLFLVPLFSRFPPFSPVFLVSPGSFIFLPMSSCPSFVLPVINVYISVCTRENEGKRENKGQRNGGRTRRGRSFFHMRTHVERPSKQSKAGFQTSKSAAGRSQFRIRSHFSVHPVNGNIGHERERGLTKHDVYGFSEWMGLTP